MKLYLIGSLRNPNVPELGKKLRTYFDVFDDWYSAGPEADDHWQQYELGRGHTFSEALQGYAARHVFEFDKHHLDAADIGVLVLPAGKSGHLELGYLLGAGKPCYIMLDGEPDRFDVMYCFADGVFTSQVELISELLRVTSGNDS